MTSRVTPAWGTGHVGRGSSVVVQPFPHCNHRARRPGSLRNTPSGVQKSLDLGYVPLLAIGWVPT